MDSKKEMELTMQKAAVVILIIAFAIICLGTAVIPVVLTLLYSWEYLLIYPGALVAFLIYAAITGKK